MIKKRPTLTEFKKKSFKNEVIRSEYQKQKLEFDLAAQLIVARKKAKLTQKQVANILHIQQPAIARFENGGYAKASLEKLETYVEALGFVLDAKLIPKKYSNHSLSNDQKKLG